MSTPITLRYNVCKGSVWPVKRGSAGALGAGPGWPWALDLDGPGRWPYRLKAGNRAKEGGMAKSKKDNFDLVNRPRPR